MSKQKKQKLLDINFENLKSWKILKKVLRFKLELKKNKFCLNPERKNLLDLEKDDILSRLCINKDLKKIIFRKNKKIENSLWVVILFLKVLESILFTYYRNWTDTLIKRRILNPLRLPVPPSKSLIKNI